MKLIVFTLLIGLVGCASTKSEKNSGSESVKKEVEVEITKEENKKKVEKEIEMKTMKKKMVSKTDESKRKFEKTVTCMSGDVERVLENKTAEEGGCEVVYSKDGGESVIANAQNNLDYCQEVVDRVANKLVAAGFNCQ